MVPVPETLLFRVMLIDWSARERIPTRALKQGHGAGSSARREGGWAIQGASATPSDLPCPHAVGPPSTAIELTLGL